MISRIVFGTVLIFFSGWYELSTARVCKKGKGEIFRDVIVFLLSFVIIYIIVGNFYFHFLELLKEEIKELPSYLSMIFSGFLSIATFRSASELIRITKRDEKEEDSGLRAVKIGTEMVMIFLGVLISLVFILLILGIKWWNYKYKTIIYFTLAGILPWMVIWFNLPRTYSPRLFKFLTIFFSIVHLVCGILCAKAYEKGWDPMRENYFEFVERKKKEEKEKILASERERVLRKLPPRKAVTPREILIPRMIYFDQRKIIEVRPKEKVRLVFLPNYSWVWESILGYEIFIDGIRYEVSREELKEKIVVRDFENSDDVPKKIIVQVSKRVLFE